MAQLVIRKSDVKKNSKPKLSCKVEIKKKYLIVHFLNDKKHYFKQEDIKRLVKWLVKERFL